MIFSICKHSYLVLFNFRLIGNESLVLGIFRCLFGISKPDAVALKIIESFTGSLNDRCYPFLSPVRSQDHRDSDSHT